MTRDDNDRPDKNLCLFYYDIMLKDLPGKLNIMFFQPGGPAGLPRTCHQLALPVV